MRAVGRRTPPYSFMMRNVKARNYNRNAVRSPIPTFSLHSAVTVVTLISCLEVMFNLAGRSETFDPFGDSGDPYWGGDEVLKWLKKFVRIQQSTVEPQLYLIDPSTQDLLNLTPPSPPNEPSSSSTAGGMDPLTARLKEARWSLLEKFARVTAFGRRTASDILEQPIVREQILPRLPPQVRDIVRSKEVQAYAGEYDSAREYLARWAAGVAEEAERQKGKRGEEVGSVWSSSSRHSGWEEMSELGGGFEVLSVLPPLPTLSMWFLLVVGCFAFVWPGG
jgi:TBC1 domain family member 15